MPLLAAGSRLVPTARYELLSNALRLEVYIQDAERENDSELVEFFRKAQHESQKGAEQGKELVKSRL